MRAPHRADSGFTTAAAGMAVILLVMVVAVGGIVASRISARHTVDNASDLAALGVAQDASSGFGDDQACANGVRIAKTNGAELTECEVVRALDEVAVRVTATIHFSRTFPGLATSVSATSYAGNAPS